MWFSLAAFSSSSYCTSISSSQHSHLLSLSQTWIFHTFDFFIDKSFVQKGIIFMNKMQQNQDLEAFFWDWWWSRNYIVAVPVTYLPPGWNKIQILKVLLVYDQLWYHWFCLLIWSWSINDMGLSQFIYYWFLSKLSLTGTALCFTKFFPVYIIYSATNLSSERVHGNF